KKKKKKKTNKQNKKKKQMNDCPNLSSVSVQYISQACSTHLHCLHVRAMELDRNTMLELSDRCKYLEELDLGSDNMYIGNSSIDDMCVFSLLSLCNLKVLSLAGLHNITDKSVCSLLKRAKLECVNLNGCNSVRMDSVCQTLYETYANDEEQAPNDSLSEPKSELVSSDDVITFPKHMNPTPFVVGVTGPSRPFTCPTESSPETQFRFNSCLDANATFRLSALKLANTDVSDVGIGYLKDLPTIQHLDLNACNSITNDVLKLFAMKTAFPKLLCLDLGLCVQLQQQQVYEFSAMRTDIRIRFY
ncbi:hypothetical protein RFI_03774, partial [Reticulomyxa filosa]